MARAHAKTNHHNKPSQQKPAAPASVVTSTAPIAHVPPAAAPSAHTAPTKDVTPPTTALPVRHGPTNEQIALRAYELFLSRGGAHGHHDEDWHQAERDLKLGR